MFITLVFKNLNVTRTISPSQDTNSDCFKLCFILLPFCYKSMNGFCVASERIQFLELRV